MADKELEIAGLIGDQMADEHPDEKARRGGRYVASAFPGGPKTKERAPWSSWGGRELPHGKYSGKAAPGPKGGDAADDIEWAKARRRQRAEEERGR